MYYADIHTHSIASGHATQATITDLAKTAKARGLTLLGVSDHAPSTMCAGTVSYFRSLSMAPKFRCGVELLYGIELNILDYTGRVDMDSATLSGLDYAIASMHRPNLRPGTPEENTAAYIGTMKNPYVSVIGHCDDAHYPADYEALTEAAVSYRVLLEINDSSLSPKGYRGDTRDNVRKILTLCKKLDHPILLSSDSHGADHVGDFRHIEPLLRECGIPDRLILNLDPVKLKRYLIR